MFAKQKKAKLFRHYYSSRADAAGGIGHCSTHGHMQRRAYYSDICALADVYIRNVAYAHSTSLTRSRPDTLVHTRAHAHAHAHSQTDGITHTDEISQT